jgi:hypothetical protein
MSNFEGKLPRPRVLRTIDNTARSNPLDDLLLPLVDESVRRQYRIRDAELRGDTELVRELQNEKSRRQVAKEKAQQAERWVSMMWQRGGIKKLTSTVICEPM